RHDCAFFSGFLEKNEFIFCFPPAEALSNVLAAFFGRLPNGRDCANMAEWLAQFFQVPLIRPLTAT
ncbi:MAG: hypothetical protein IJS51_06755, partial [Treponema sp.]|nr:hypothetical protein [Treponema sp.]